MKKKLQACAAAALLALLVLEPWPGRMPLLDVGGPAEAYAPCNVLAANVVYWTGEFEHWKAIVDAGAPWPAGALQAYANATYALTEAINDYTWHCSG